MIFSFSAHLKHKNRAVLSPAMKRETPEDTPAEINDEQDASKIDNLSFMTIQTAFDSLPLQKKRTLIPGLLKSARIVHTLFIDEVEPKFKTWITSGKVKVLTEEQVEKMWGLWNLAKKIAVSAHVNYWSDNNGVKTMDFLIAPNVHGVIPESRLFLIPYLENDDEDEDDDDKDCLSKEDYFDWILENTVPKQVRLKDVKDDDRIWFYRFTSLECEEDDCKCSLTLEGVSKFHGWTN